MYIIKATPIFESWWYRRHWWWQCTWSRLEWRLLVVMTITT